MSRPETDIDKEERDVDAGGATRGEDGGSGQGTGPAVVEDQPGGYGVTVRVGVVVGSKGVIVERVTGLIHAVHQVDPGRALCHPHHPHTVHVASVRITVLWGILLFVILHFCGRNKVPLDVTSAAHNSHIQLIYLQLRKFYNLLSYL